MRFNAEDDGDMEINMTPMIDCVFLLLIFFLVATVMKKPEKEVKVQLPQAAHATDRKFKEEKILVIGIDAKGQFYLDGEQAGLERLGQTLKELGRSNPQQRIRIDGDQRAAFQDLTHILDLCNFEGLTNVGIHIQPDGGRKR